jgi:hypothetical protein
MQIRTIANWSGRWCFSSSAIEISSARYLSSLTFEVRKHTAAHEFWRPVLSPGCPLPDPGVVFASVLAHSEPNPPGR